MNAPRRVVVASSGASGAIHDVRWSQAPRGIRGVESHWVVSDGFVKRACLGD